MAGPTTRRTLLDCETPFGWLTELLTELESINGNAPRLVTCTHYIPMPSLSEQIAVGELVVKRECAHAELELKNQPRTCTS